MPSARMGATTDATLRMMPATIRSCWTQAEGYQKFLYWTGTLLIVSAVFHTGVLLVTGGSLEGPVSWRKPILFGEAFGLTALTVGWVMTFLSKRRVLGWILSGSLGLANAGEVFWISMQQWRGVPSHFNVASAFDQAAFSVAGVLIVFTVFVVTVVTVWTYFPMQSPRSPTAAIRAGMTLLFAAQIFGILMILNDSSTFGAEGAMKVPHALALHAAQILPGLAWLLLFTKWSENQRTAAVVVAVAGYAGLVTVSAFQTFSGLAASDMSLLAALVFWISMAGLFSACVADRDPADGGPSPNMKHDSPLNHLGKSS